MDQGSPWVEGTVAEHKALFALMVRISPPPPPVQVCSLDRSLFRRRELRLSYCVFIYHETCGSSTKSLPLSPETWALRVLRAEGGSQGRMGFEMWGLGDPQVRVVGSHVGRESPLVS